MKINTFRIYKGGLGGPEAEEIFKKSNKIEAFPNFFFCFLARLPKSPKL